MGYLVVPDIKDEAVVCQSSDPLKRCGHFDCEGLRQLWGKATCRICDQKLTAGQKFYFDPEGLEGNPVHAICLIEEKEEGD